MGSVGCNAGILPCVANCAQNGARAGTGNKVAPDSALLRPSRPCSFDGRVVPGTATGDRGRNAALATAPPAAPSVASGPTTRGSSGVAAVQIGSPRKGSIRLRAWVRSRWVCLRLSWIFGASFAVKGLRSWVGSARWESADLRASGSDALPRPVPRRARAGLAGAHAAPAPGWWFSQARNERTLSELNVRCARLLE